MNEEIKKLISDAKNICLIPSQTNEPESLTSALALFYILRELGKNVNLIIEDFPERLHFLVPSMDFITSPKNVVISIPRNIADISQIYYEKDDAELKIHLTIDKGTIKKENFSLYFSQIKPDLIITLGIQNFRQELENRLESFGFLLDTPIVNIDNHENNLQFGTVNMIETKSLGEIILDIIHLINPSLPGSSIYTKEVSSCILAGLVIHYENFKKPQLEPKVFELAGQLVKDGANYHQIVSTLQKMTKEEMDFLYKIFQNLKTSDNYDGSYAMIESKEFQHFGEREASFAVEKMKTIGIDNSLLVLWPSHASDPMIKGFFYSKRQNLINKVFALSDTSLSGGAPIHTSVKNDWVFLSIPGSDLQSAKEKIINLV